MRTVRSLLPVVLFTAVRAAAQAPEGPCAAIKTTTLPPCDAPAAKTKAPALATVDGVALAAELDAELQKKIENLDAAVAAARREALEAEIADVRLHLEAERRGTSFPAFWEAEVLRKTPPPSAAELQALFEKFKKWYPGKTLEDVRPRLEGIVTAQNREKREAELAASLKDRFPTTAGADPGAAALPTDAVLATVGGRTITAASAATRLDAAGYGVRREVWMSEREAVEKAVAARLLQAEAARRGTTPEALRKAEIDDKLVPPTPEDLAKEWEKVKKEASGSFEDNRAALAERIVKDRREKLEEGLEKTLKAGRAVDLHVDPPPAPALSVDVTGAPWRGKADAAVTLVEYADFECPHCARGFQQAEELLRTHGDRVRYVLRNYPLPFHEHAQKAAEAGLAAHAQGRFFELAGLMFQRQDALDTASLKKYAAEAGCDPARFARDLDAGRLAVPTLLERRDAERVGVAWTPSFFVNGVPVMWDGTVGPLRAAVDAALAKAGATPAALPPAKAASR